MLQEGSNELGGEVITNERVMCRMAYLVARTLTLFGQNNITAWGRHSTE